MKKIPRQLTKKFAQYFCVLALTANIYILLRSQLSSAVDEVKVAEIKATETENLVDQDGKIEAAEIKVSDTTRLVDQDGKTDWHDYDFMAYEKTRTGPGEQGKPVKLTKPNEIFEDKKTFNDEGYSRYISEMISPNRSHPDIRHEKCKAMKYLSKLPSTSVIVIFYDEDWSLILRCLHSIWNRTPKDLLHEIILFNDKSSKQDLPYALKSYVADNFGEKVKFFQNKERKGLIQTRLEGARKATGDVIVFLDSHMEVNVNWLPPLLEPIQLNPKTACVPILDSFSPYTLEYEFLGHGTRGGFDWGLVFKWMPMRPQDTESSPTPFEYPVMTGGGYAIRKDFFFELGGYDEGMMIWNGENYEMSFKIWLCGGRMLQVPCSHVAHTSKLNSKYKLADYGIDYSARNLKRVAEVWMDEFKTELYKSDPARYNRADAGDLTEALALKKRLNCKPFKYFLDEVAPEIRERYNPSTWGKFASGAIISEANSNFCVSYMYGQFEKPLELTTCSVDKVNPSWSQSFIFTWNRFIKHDDANWKCIDAATINLMDCHFTFGHQLWKYDLKTHQIINFPHNNCITADLDIKKLISKECNETDVNQKWNMGYLNTTAIENWQTFGAKVPYEI